MCGYYACKIQMLVIPFGGHMIANHIINTIE